MYDYFRSSRTHRRVKVRKASGIHRYGYNSTHSYLRRDLRRVSQYSEKQLSYNEAMNDEAFTTNFRSNVSVFKSYRKMLTKLWIPNIKGKRSLFSVNISYNPLPDNYLGIVFTTGDIVLVSHSLLSRWFRTNCALLSEFCLCIKNNSMSDRFCSQNRNSSNK